MRLDEDPAEANHSEPRFQQRILSNVEAQSIQIGRIVQMIVYLGLPFNNRHRRFMQWLSIGVYLACLIGGFIRLWQNGADLIALLLLIVGSGLLSLTCLYYAGFWKPEVQDKSAPSSEPPDSDESVKVQRTKQRSRQRVRRLAMVGIFAIPLLTCAGFFAWRSLPAPNVLLLVADFDGVEQQKYQVTENILRNLRNATDPYADVKVQGLNQIITEQQGSEVARAVGERKKASIVIWGGYGVTSTNVQVSVHFEVLKPPNYFPKLEKTATGEAQTLAVAELNSFKLQTRLSKEMSYLTLYTLGMVEYAKKDWDGAVVRFKSALYQVKEPVTSLSQDAVYFYLGSSHHHKSDYTQAIANYTQALKLKPDDVDAYNNRGVAYNNQGNHTQAIADYNQVLKLKPNYADAYNNRGVAYDNQGNHTQAIADYNQALKLKPDLAAAYNNRGNTYANQGNYTQAIADYNQALKLKPDDAEAYNNRGVAYDNQGNHTQAIADYNQALKL
ncbi:MAG: tetratricopeptide repeat protein, partial [Nostoc sp. SerVER01]